MLFYVIFYAVLSGFFGAMLAVFYQTLDPNAPKWQLDNSLIGSNPGLGFRPMPPESNVESTLIWYKASDEGNYLHWTRELDRFLEGEKDLRSTIFNIQTHETDQIIFDNYFWLTDTKKASTKKAFQYRFHIVYEQINIYNLAIRIFERNS